MIVPVYGNVLVLPDEVSPVTSGGVILPVSTKRPLSEGVVESVGEGVEDVGVGDRVCYGAGCGVPVDGKLLLSESEILFVHGGQ